MKKHKQNNEASGQSALESSPSHLLHRVLQIALDIYTVSSGEGALTQRQYAVLKALDEARSSGAGTTQTDLVQATGIDRSTLADMVTRMTAKGLLIREKSASDGRANLVSLSPEGVAALQDTLPKVLAADAAILNLLSPPKRDSFVKLLRKLTQARAEQLMALDIAEAEPKGEKAAKKAADKKADKPQKKAPKDASEKLEKKKKAKKPEKPQKKAAKEAGDKAKPEALEKAEA